MMGMMLAIYALPVLAIALVVAATAAVASPQDLGAPRSPRPSCCRRQPSH